MEKSQRKKSHKKYVTIVLFVPFLKRMSHKQHIKNQTHRPVCDICDFFLKKLKMLFSQK
nr:MAG TPA: zinc knuckle protein [Caudoviricetes sp.]